MFRTVVLAAAALLVPAVAGAAEDEESLLEELPPVQLDRIPPETSWEFGIQASWGTISHWREEVPPWPGLGFRFAAGKHYGPHRLGGGLAFSIEGPAPIHFNGLLEPQATWDWITGKLQVGASVGPSLIVHSKLLLSSTDRSFAVAPSAGVRIGYSQGWTRVGRRFFAVLEPRIRWTDNHPNPALMLWVGSGGGR